jgi:hypothetical protein
MALEGIERQTNSVLSRTRFWLKARKTLEGIESARDALCRSGFLPGQGDHGATGFAL